jgi:hypothetical protein
LELDKIGRNATETLELEKKQAENLKAVKVFARMRPLLEKKYPKPFEMYKLIFCDYTHGPTSTTYLGKVQVSAKEYLHVVLHKTNEDVIGAEIRGKEHLPKHADSTRLWKRTEKDRNPENEGDLRLLFHTREEIDEEELLTEAKFPQTGED